MKITSHLLNNLKILIFILIFVFFTASQVTAQSPNIYDYGVTYKVKMGDSNEYRYTAIYNNGKNYLTSTYQSANGSYLPVNVTTKTTFTITVLNVIENTNGTGQASLQTKINNPGQPVITSNNSFGSTYLIPAFDNQSIVKKFISVLSLYVSNQSTSPSNTVDYSVEGDYIKLATSNNFTDIYGNNNDNYNFAITSELALSWKTGWLEYTKVKQVANNGTVIINYKLERVSNNLVNQAIDNAITGLTFASLAAVVIVPMFTFYSYKKFSKSPKGTNRNITFSEYIKSKGKKRPANKINSPTGSTKALDMIDEILQENK